MAKTQGQKPTRRRRLLSRWRKPQAEVLPLADDEPSAAAETPVRGWRARRRANRTRTPVADDAAAVDVPSEPAAARPKRWRRRSGPAAAGAPDDFHRRGPLEIWRASLRQPRTLPVPSEMGDKPVLVAPPWQLLLLETRAPLERAVLRSARNLLRRAPRGDGHPVLVVPGFTGSDVSTADLRRFLDEQGFAARDWGQGRNVGLLPGLLERLVERLDAIHAQDGRTVSIVGYSLGGLFAREIAKRRPDAVRSVVTLASPFAGPPRANRVWHIYEAASGHSLDQITPEETAALAVAPPCPTTSIFSRSDGVVNWRACLQEPGGLTENLEVVSSHLGLRHHPLALFAICDRLAQTEGAWRPFMRAGALKYLFPDPRR
ncbi:esterase/lipase family protein [Marinivivus vitaminiproducens]|uniref:esterase/lipase family protein n=1 Tax=Marinivivus vitaminiproducens TaxID=3035935 RepID=UPI0027A40DE7|nr:alpha/beta fold hydrolase [Geminicoccaceae bacterium SCSIO 64248]